MKQLIALLSVLVASTVSFADVTLNQLPGVYKSSQAVTQDSTLIRTISIPANVQEAQLVEILKAKDQEQQILKNDIVKLECKDAIVVCRVKNSDGLIKLNPNGTLTFESSGQPRTFNRLQ